MESGIKNVVYADGSFSGVPAEAQEVEHFKHEEEFI